VDFLPKDVVQNVGHFAGLSTFVSCLCAKHKHVYIQISLSLWAQYIDLKLDPYQYSLYATRIFLIQACLTIHYNHTEKQNSSAWAKKC